MRSSSPDEKNAVALSPAFAVVAVVARVARSTVIVFGTCASVTLPDDSAALVRRGYVARDEGDRARSTLGTHPGQPS